MTFPAPTQFDKINKLELSNSSVNMFHSCERKFEFRKLYASSRRDEGYATGVGTALHEGIQSFLTDGDFDKAVFKMLMAYPIQFQTTPMDQKSVQACYATLKQACTFDKINEYELAYFINENGDKVPGVEVSFILRLEDYPWYENGETIPIDYIGFIDLVMYNKLEDKYIVWDIKTTSKDSDMSVQFAFDDQCLPYGLVLEQLLGRKYQSGFEIAYWVVYIHPMESKNKFYSFIKSADDVQEWMRKYLLTLQHMKTYYNMGWFPRRGTACTAWNRPCTFFSLCESRNGPALEKLIAMENANLQTNERPKPSIVIDLSVDYEVGI